MFEKNILLLLVLMLTLLSSTNTTMAIAIAIEELDISVMNGTAIPYAREDHLAYGIVKMWNKAADPVVTTISLTPDRNHYTDDNKYWGNYKEEENIKIGADELRIQIFCFTIPAGSELGQQTWTLNVTAEGKTITKKVAVNLPVTKNVKIATPSWQPDIFKLEFPAGKPDTFSVEVNKPTVIVSLFDIAGNLNSKKAYDVELEAPLPDIFFSYPEEITVEMSKPKEWDFDNQTFLPFTVIPIPLITANVPCSVSDNGNMYKLELQLEEERTNLKASLPFQLVVAMPSPAEKIIEAEVVKKNATTLNETVNGNKNAVVTETAVAVNSLEVTKLASISKMEKTNNKWTWSRVSQLNNDMWNFIISKMRLLARQLRIE